MLRWLHETNIERSCMHKRASYFLAQKGNCREDAENRSDGTAGKDCLENKSELGRLISGGEDPANVDEVVADDREADPTFHPVVASVSRSVEAMTPF